MQYDYFYGCTGGTIFILSDSKSAFYGHPIQRFVHRCKVLYGILLDRMSLSLKNHWLDEQNRVYIIFTLEEIMESLNCANQKATRLMVELEKKVGLIERKRQGLGKPCLIYVKNFVTPK